MGGIELGINQDGVLHVTSQFHKELNINSDERTLADHFISVISQHDDVSAVSVERRSSNYLSICVNGFDFLRFKFTDQARWISIDVTDLDIPEDDARFVAQTNKNQRFWKAAIKDLESLDQFDIDVYNSYRYAKEVM